MKRPPCPACHCRPRCGCCECCSKPLRRPHKCDKVASMAKRRCYICGDLSKVSK